MSAKRPRAFEAAEARAVAEARAAVAEAQAIASKKQFLDLKDRAAAAKARATPYLLAPMMEEEGVSVRIVLLWELQICKCAPPTLTMDLAKHEHVR